MVVIQCIDNRGGTAFNARRQSQDQLLRARVLAKLRGRRLWMNSYSRRQFQKDLPPEFPISVDEDFLARAGTGDVCFVEGLPLSPWLDRIEAVIQHNESDIATWIPLEYQLQQTYGWENLEEFPAMLALRRQVLADTQEKIRAAGGEPETQQDQ